MWLFNNLRISFKVCSPSPDDPVFINDLLKFTLTPLTSLTRDEKFVPKESSLLSSISASLYAFSRASSFVSLLLPDIELAKEGDDFSIEAVNFSACFSYPESKRSSSSCCLSI